MIKIFDKIIFIISLISLIGLSGAYGARYVNPHFWVLPSLLGLAYPYLLILNVLLLFYWIARWKKTALLFILVIAIGIPSFTSYYGTHQNTKDPQSPDLTVLSYNVRYFDKYGWNKNKNTSSKLLDYLNQFKGDIACLQEFPTDNSSTLKRQKLIQELPTFPYHYLDKDMAIFSRLPIIRTGKITFNRKHTGSALFCDILKNKDTIRVYNIHLESYRLGNKERKFVQNISQGSANDLSQGFKNILSRFISANKNRADQALQLRKHLQASPFPLILCGDFNDTPLSYTYRTIGNQLTDSFLEKGRGLGNTYIGEFPSFRIDYIFHSPQFTTLNYTRSSITLSDHYPISCQIKIKK